MKSYTIETLEIEMNKIKESLRIAEKYSVYPEYNFDCKELLNHLAELKMAIKILSSSANL